MKVTISSKNESFHAETKYKKTATKFSNSSHIILPKEYIGRDVILFILKKALHIKGKFIKTANYKKL